MSRVIKNILKRWYIYIITIVVAVIATNYYCDFITMPRKEKTLTIFMSTYDTNNRKITDYLMANKPDYLKEIDVVTAPINSPDFSYYFVNRGLNKADIFILPEEHIDDTIIAKQFAYLDSDYLNNYFCYTSAKDDKAIVLHSIGEGENNKLFTFLEDGQEDQNLYIFYRKNSIHIGELNNSEFDTALKLTKSILEYEE